MIILPSVQAGIISSRNINYTNGLYGKRYLQYFGSLIGDTDDVNWFATATLHGDINQLTEFNRFSSSANRNSEENYSWQWLGYFKASSTENYTFYTNSDDASYLWIGNNAISSFTVANATVNNGGLHGNQEASGTASLTSGVYYPIRIQFGEQGGGDVMTFNYSTPTIPKTTDVTGRVFYNATTNGF